VLGVITMKKDLDDMGTFFQKIPLLLSHQPGRHHFSVQQAGNGSQKFLAAGQKQHKKK